MKEIKAYIKTERIEPVIQALEKAGAPGITVVEVPPVGYGFDANYFSHAKETAKRYFHITKLEVVCRDDEALTLLEAIRQSAYTGNKGDGVIFLSPVEKALKIRDGALDKAALK